MLAEREIVGDHQEITISLKIFFYKLKLRIRSLRVSLLKAHRLKWMIAGSEMTSHTLKLNLLFLSSIQMRLKLVH